jgi:hypothetical protein
MQFPRRTVLWIFAIVLATPVTAVELHPVEVRTGTVGLASVPLSVTNAAAAPITCVGELAHWYSTDLAHAGPGAIARIPLWLDPATGTYTVLNDKRENMPVEALWCGVDGMAYATRSMIALERRAGTVPGALAVTCAATGTGGLDCE